VEKKKYEKVGRDMPADSNLTPEDNERITRAFKFTLRKIQKLQDSQIATYKYLKEVKKRLRDLEKRVWRFIEPN